MSAQYWSFAADAFEQRFRSFPEHVPEAQWELIARCAPDLPYHVAVEQATRAPNGQRGFDNRSALESLLAYACRECTGSKWYAGYDRITHLFMDMDVGTGIANALSPAELDLWMGLTTTLGLVPQDLGPAAAPQPNLPWWVGKLRKDHWLGFTHSDVIRKTLDGLASTTIIARVGALGDHSYANAAEELRSLVSFLDGASRSPHFVLGIDSQ